MFKKCFIMLDIIRKHFKIEIEYFGLNLQWHETEIKRNSFFN